jgi:putative transposase
MIAYIHAHRDRFGVEPICRVLPIAPSTYYAASRRPASARAGRDEQLKVELARVHAEHLGVYGARKVWRQLHREGTLVARCTVERLLGELHLQGVRRGKTRRTPPPRRPRRAPPTWWIATSPPSDPTSSGWPTSPTWRPGRGCLRGLGHRRVQPLPGRLAGRAVAAHRPGVGRAGDGHLAPAGPAGGAGAPPGQGRPIPIDSLHRTLGRGGSGHLGGSRGDSYDNALAETIIGLYKTELIRRRGPWRAWTRSSTPPWSGSTGSTTAGCWSRSGTSRRPSSRPPTIQGKTPAALRHSRTPTSGEPGAVQLVWDMATSMELILTAPGSGPHRHGNPVPRYRSQARSMNSRSGDRPNGRTG